MITPAYAITATERILPRMALDFTTGVLDSRVTVTRALNTATAINSSGVIAIVNANLPRFDYDPVTLVAKGLLVEEQRTNLLLNSLIDGTALSTQTVTVTAVAHTISFYGTGTITLSGASSATVSGTGAYPNRKTLTFTPTAGALICTVSGTVQFAQLEVGVFATSFIPTAATTVTRSADQVVMTGTNFSSWYNQNEGAFVLEASSFVPSNLVLTYNVLTVSDGTANNTNRIGIYSNFWFAETRTGNVAQANLSTTGSYVTNTTAKIAYTYKTNSFAYSANAGTLRTDVSGTVPVVLTRMDIGSGFGVFFSGYIRRISYWPQRIINAEASAFSK